MSWKSARLWSDILSVKLLVWMFGHDSECLDAHLFLYHRYSELSDCQLEAGHLVKAEWYDTLAELHYQAAPDDDDTPPEGVAVAMPLPRRPLRTAAIGLPLDGAPRDRCDPFEARALGLY